MIVQSDLLKIKKATHKYFYGELKEGGKPLNYLAKDELVGYFKGVRTFLNFLLEEMPVAPDNWDSSSNLGSGSFNSFSNYEIAMDTFINRSETLVDFNEIYEPLQVFEEVGNNVEYDVTGDFIDMSKYMEGVPEVFGSLHDGNQRRYRANIVINLSWRWDVEPETINARLKNILAFVDWLEANNIRCSITGVTSNECGHLEVNVKDHDETLDLRELAVVSHPEFLRRATFRFREYSQTIDSGYGNSRSFGLTMEGEANKELKHQEELEIFVDSIDNHDPLSFYERRFNDAKEKVKKIIEERRGVKIVV